MSHQAGIVKLAEQSNLSHAGPGEATREAELKPLPSIGCRDVLFTFGRIGNGESAGSRTNGAQGEKGQSAGR